MARRKNETVAASWEPSAGRDPCAPERYLQSQSKPNIDFEGLVGRGDNPNGYRAITPNGVASDHGNGRNQRQWAWNTPVDGEKFGGKVDWDRNKNANRTGE